jgi:hypothetical protein
MAVAVTQSRYRFRADTLTVDSAAPTWGAAENAAWVPIPIQRGVPFRVRFELFNTGSTSTGAQAWRIFAQKNGAGGYTQVNSTRSDGIQTSTAACVDPDNTALTVARLTNDAPGTPAWVNGQIDTNGATGNITLGAGNSTARKTELEFGLVLTAACAKGDYFDLRVYRGTNTALSTYAATPRVTCTQYALICAGGSLASKIADTISAETRASAGGGSLALTGIDVAFAGFNNYVLACDGGFYTTVLSAATYDYSFGVDAGSLSLTGQPVVLQKAVAYALVCQQGVISSRIADDVTIATRGTAASGSLVVSGVAADLSTARAFAMQCEGRSLALTGVSAALARNYRLAAAGAVCSLSGKTVNLDVSVTVACVTLTLNGQPVAVKTRRIGASGSAVLSGQSVLISLSRTGSQGTIAVAPQPLRFRIGRTAQSGSLVLSGQQAAFSRAYRIACIRGTFSLSGLVASAKADRRLVLGQGSLTLAGQVMTRRLKLPGIAGSLALSGRASNFARSRKQLAAQGVFGLTGQGVTLSRGASYTLVCAGNAFALKIADQITRTIVGHMPVDQVAIAGQAVALRAARRVEPVAGAYVVSGPSSTAEVYSEHLSGSINVLGQALSFKRSQAHSLPLAPGSLAWNGFGAALAKSGTGRSLLAGQGGYTLKIADQVTHTIVGHMPVGQVAIAGTAVTLRAARIFETAGGAYAVSGPSSTAEVYSEHLTGSINVLGQTLSFERSQAHSLPLAPGFLAWNGVGATLAKGGTGRSLSAGHGAYTSRIADQVSIAIGGFAARGNVALTGNAVSLSIGGR